MGVSGCAHQGTHRNISIPSGMMIISAVPVSNPAPNSVRMRIRLDCAGVDVDPLPFVRHIGVYLKRGQ